MNAILATLTIGFGVIVLAVIASIAITWCAHCSDVKTNFEDDDNTQ